MAKKGKPPVTQAPDAPARLGDRSALMGTRVVYCGNGLEQLAKLPDRCSGLICIGPPLNSRRN